MRLVAGERERARHDDAIAAHDARRRERMIRAIRTGFDDGDVEPHRAIERAGDDYFEAIAGRERAHVVARHAAAFTHDVDLDDAVPFDARDTFFHRLAR